MLENLNSKYNYVIYCNFDAKYLTNATFNGNDILSWINTLEFIFNISYFLEGNPNFDLGRNLILNDFP